MLEDTFSQTRDQVLDDTIVYVDTHFVKLSSFHTLRITIFFYLFFYSEYLYLSSHLVSLFDKILGFVYGTKACCHYGDGEYYFNREI